MIYLVENKEVLNHIEELFTQLYFNSYIRCQQTTGIGALQSQVLHNANGTAPGMWITNDIATFVSLAGSSF